MDVMGVIIFVQSFLKAVQAFGALKVGGVLVGGLIAVYFLLRGLDPFLERMRYEHAILLASERHLIENTQVSAGPVVLAQAGSKEDAVPKNDTKTGDVTVTGNQGPTQVNIGSPGSKQVVNQQRAISPQATFETSKRGAEYVLQVILTQTPGLWDSGTPLQIGANFSGPYSTAAIVQGLPPAQFNVLTSENKEAGEFFYSTATAPFPDRPIVLEVVSPQRITLKQLSVSPLATK